MRALRSAGPTEATVWLDETVLVVNDEDLCLPALVAAHLAHASDDHDASVAHDTVDHQRERP